MAGKEIKYDAKAREKIIKGVDAIADAVKVTLGPKGRNVLINKSWGSPKITKDGVTVTKELELKDRFENMGAQMVKEVASETSDNAGDGTTTATVLARAIYREGAKLVAAGVNLMSIKRGIDKAVALVVEELQKMSKSIKDKKDITQVGTISANNDHAIGDIIAEAMEKVGKEGVITVEEAQVMETTLKVVDGLQFDHEPGLLRPHGQEYALARPHESYSALHYLQALVFANLPVKASSSSSCPGIHIGILKMRNSAGTYTHAIIDEEKWTLSLCWQVLAEL